MCLCNPGGNLGGNLAQAPTPNTSPPDSYYRDEDGGVVEWQAARNASSVPQRSHLTGTGCVWTGGKRSDFSL